MTRLLDHPLSPYAQKVKIALNLKNVAFEARMPEAIGSGRAAADFLASNFRAEVPVLIDGDAAIFDSTMILDYIDDKWPAPPLLPTDPLARARARMIEEVADTQLEAINWGLGEIRYFGRAEGELAQRLETAAKRDITRILTWAEGLLGAGPWFHGADIGRADLALLPFVAGSAAFGYGPEPGGPLAQWFERARTHAAVAPVLAAARAAAPGFALARQAVESGLMRREYRDHRLEWMIRAGGIEVVARGLERGDIRFSHLPG